MKKSRGGSTCTTASCNAIIAWIKGIAPPQHYSPSDVPLAAINNPAILDQLQYPICLMILCQPRELPCRALVCTTCTVKWFMEFKCIEVKCPCCYTQLKLAELKPASQLITTRLKDAMVHCIACKWDLKAEEEKSVHYHWSTSLKFSTAFSLLAQCHSIYD